MLLKRCVKIARDELAAGFHKDNSHRHWSFVVQNNRLLEYGRNRLSDPDRLFRFGYKTERHSLHSEAVAMRKAYGLLDRRKPWTMINVRLDYIGNLRTSAPCTLCRSFISACGCSMCHFTITDGFAKITL